MVKKTKTATKKGSTAAAPAEPVQPPMVQAGHGSPMPEEAPVAPAPQMPSKPKAAKPKTAKTAKPKTAAKPNSTASCDAAAKKSYKRAHTYAKMVQRTLWQNKNGKHLSPKTILRNMREVYPIESERALANIWKELKAGAEAGAYLRVGNSFRLSPNTRVKLSKKTKRRRAKRAKKTADPNAATAAGVAMAPVVA